MDADLHIHMILDGVWFRTAIDAHRNGPRDDLIRQRLAAYRDSGIRYLRDGGDRWGVCRRAKELAPEYGIVYQMPAFPIHKQGHYGGFLGRSWQDLSDYRLLVREAADQGANFIKLMVSGLMDFSQAGRLTEDSLTAEEMKSLIAIAHDAGFAVMAHCNGAAAVMAAVAAGVDSIEHGAYLNIDACHALAESDAVWVPTLSTIGNLLGCGRFPDDELRKILDGAMENVRTVAALGGKIGLGSDAGAFCVPHPKGAGTEAALLHQALGPQADEILAQGQRAIRRRFGA